jgi:hypothetical protein
MAKEGVRKQCATHARDNIIASLSDITGIFFIFYVKHLKIIIKNVTAYPLYSGEYANG